MFNPFFRFPVLLLIGVLSSLVVSAQQATGNERADDRASGTISGRVVSESGQPLSNAAVNVRTLNSGQTRTTTTSADGTFVVRGLDPALFVVSAFLPTYVNKARQPNSEPVFYRPGDNVRIELSKGGVITGTVVAPNGEPIVGIRVRVYLVRDENGNRTRVAVMYGDRPTDDRGIYRIYGLPAGVYIVAAGGASLGYFSMSEFDSEGQTFAPSSTRDTASEVTVRSGEEMTNVDIRFRPEGGHQVTGTVRGSSESGFMRQFTVMLRPVSTGMPPITGFQPPGTSGFAFSGVSDGSYDLIAQSSIAPGEMFVSDPYRIVVKGGDVTGIELVTKSLGSITGKLLLEASKDPECKGKRRPVLAETLIVPLLNSEKNKTDELRPIVGLAFPTVPDSDGVFSFRNLSANEYRFETRLLARYWYVQSISLPTSERQATNRSIDLTRNWLNVKSGERITGLSITLAEGAVSFKGSVASPENSPLPQRLYLHLVPAEREQADNVLRFFVTPVNEDRSFTLTNLPPGRYWALLGTIAKQDSPITSSLRRPEEIESRAQLRRDAEAAKTEIELKPCQNIDGYLLTFKPTAPSSKQP